MKNLLTILCIGIVINTYAQEFEISAELRPRFEYRHGYKTLAVDSLQAAAFVSQRTRLNLDYSSKKTQAFFALQNVRVWGDVSTLAISDKNGTMIHQAWAKLLFHSKFSVKIGRQEIAYDDHRIFGNVGWAQQARSHDAFIASFTPNNNQRIDLGLAINEEAETIFNSEYTTNNSKNFQYLWYHNKMKAINLSFLFLNHGLTYTNNDAEQKIAYNQTIGSRITLNKNKVQANASLYYQMGKIANTDLSAFNIAGNVFYNMNDKFNLGIGAEYLSGTDSDRADGKLKSFNPWFGTNHKFNGYMDYFYVGNHTNSVGLLDVHATLAFQKNKFSAKIIPHLFNSAAQVIDANGNKLSNNLGTELDMVVGYKWLKTVNIQAGYSQLFATNTMQALKAGNNDASNNWAWLMVTVNPSLFKTKFEKQ